MMKKKITIMSIITLLVFAVVIDATAGGGNRNGTAGAQELLIPVGARGLALNSSYISGLEGIEAIFYNPAGLGITKNSAEAMFSKMAYIGDIGVSYAAVSATFEGLGALAFSVKSIDFGEIPITTVEAPEGTGSTFSPNFVTVGITYSNSLTDRIRVGVNANVISERIIRSSATGISFDAGVQYNGLAGFDGLKLGVVLKNLGPQMKYDGPDLLRRAQDINSQRGNQYYKIDAASFELPSQLELGIGFERKFAEMYKFLISTSFQNNNFANDEYKLGGEFSFRDILFFRGGYSFVANVDDDEQKIYGFTMGTGLHIDVGVDINIDYAYRWARYFDANHMFSLKLGF